MWITCETLTRCRIISVYNSIYCYHIHFKNNRVWRYVLCFSYVVGCSSGGRKAGWTSLQRNPSWPWQTLHGSVVQGWRRHPTLQVIHNIITTKSYSKLVLFKIQQIKVLICCLIVNIFSFFLNCSMFNIYNLTFTTGLV